MSFLSSGTVETLTIVKRSEAKAHEKDCPNRWIKCESCPVSLDKRYMSHEKKRHLEKYVYEHALSEEIKKLKEEAKRFEERFAKLEEQCEQGFLEISRLKRSREEMERSGGGGGGGSGGGVGFSSPFHYSSHPSSFHSSPPPSFVDEENEGYNRGDSRKRFRQDNE